MEIKIKKQFRGLNLLYLAILGLMSIAVVLSVVMVYKAGAIPVFASEELGTIKAIVIIALLVGIPVSHIFYYKKIKHINPKLQLAQKISMFKTAFIVRISVLEAIGLLAIIGYFVTADKSFLYMFGVVFVLFIIHAPTKQRISNDLELSEEEDEELNK